VTAAPTTAPSVMRLPWAATAASLVAFVALFLSEKGSLMLPILAAALLASYAFPFRLEAKPGLSWIVRIALWGIVLTLALLRQNGQSNDFNDAPKVGWIGEMFAVELVVQAWRNRPEGGHRGVITILLSGVVFGFACNVYDMGELHFIPFLTPVYALFLALSLRQFRAPAQRPASPAAQHPWQRILILVLALGCGFLNYYLFHNFRQELTNLAMQALHEKVKIEPKGMSWNPQLNATFGLQGSDERVLRLTGSADLSHLRGMAFDTYSNGKWGPPRQLRTLIHIASKEMPPVGTGSIVKATRLVTNEGMLFVPLNMSSLDLLDGSELNWSREFGSPIVTDSAAPNDYTFTVGAEGYQGPLCAAPTEDQRHRLLQVPPEVDPRVRALAQQIGGALPGPLQRAEAIQAYLMTNHRYSLQTNPGRGDPVSNFLLQKKAAHCEFFASAAVILSRCLGIPARYVVGYYAHESEGEATIVRQRDAHAWAECWIEGRGWMTLDATPASGRPDQDTRPISAWTRLREWLQDSMQRLREAASGGNGLRLLLVVMAIALVALLWQWRRQTRLPKPTKSRAFAYTAGQAELTAQFARFEAYCRKQGLACPPGQTWQEYLAHRTPEDLPPGFDREQALAFVRAYNAARFGTPSSDALARLQELLPRGETS